jgi:hypothetical protein
MKLLLSMVSPKSELKFTRMILHNVNIFFQSVIRPSCEIFQWDELFVHCSILLRTQHT